MDASGWLQFALYFAALVLITKPMGLYLLQVLDANGRTWLDPVLRPLERLTYRLMGVDSSKEHNWKQYTLAMLLFSLVSCLFTYAILRLQNLLPLNPQGLGAVSADLAFNTAVSFTTNTNWQNYVAESTMSYFSQMVGLAFHNFASAATGIAIAAALVRAIARHSATTLGNFWVDLVRVTYYLLLPICLVFAVFLVSQGMIQNFKPYTKATLAEPMKVQVEKKNDTGETIKGADDKPVMEEQTVTEQNIAQGPMASQVAIKMLGTNGGGYANANAAHPFENPTHSPISFRCYLFSRSEAGSLITSVEWSKTRSTAGRFGPRCRSCLSVAFCSAGGPRAQAIQFIINSALLPLTVTWGARKSVSAFLVPHSLPRSRQMHRAARLI